MADPIKPESVELVYDGQCPVCTIYCCNVTARNGVTLKLVDARQTSATMQAITAARLDIDEGMVLKIGSHLHYGSDAIMALNAYLEPKTKMAWLNRLFFGNHRRAKVFYALGKAARNGILRLLGIQKINNLQPPTR